MKKLLAILTIGWMCFILYQGTQVGEASLEKSDVIVTQIMKMIDWWEETFPKKEEAPTPSAVEMPKPTTPTTPSIDPKVELQQTLSYLVRKAAHFIEYLILGILLYFILRVFNVSVINQSIYALFVVLLCAVLDEYFQSFLARTSSVSDVLLDFSGGLVGITCVRVALWYSKYSKSKGMKVN